MGAEAAARLGNEIAPGFGLAAMIGGAVVGMIAGAAIVAAAGRASGYDGILAPSARNPGGDNIIIFPKGP